MDLIWEQAEAYSRSILFGGKPGWLQMADAALPLHEATRAVRFFQ